LWARALRATLLGLAAARRRTVAATRIASLRAPGAFRFGRRCLAPLAAALALGATLLTPTAAAAAAPGAAAAAAPVPFTFFVLLARRTAAARLTIAAALGRLLLLIALLSRALLLVALATALAASATTLRPPPPAATAPLAGRHVELGTVLEGIFAQRGADLGASCADTQKPATGMMKNFDLDTVAADSKLVQRDLDGLVDSDSLCFDHGRHDKGLS
jgi:hypothetical protein